ncbi:putative membrane protein [Secundilactobacillus oryzae JCM 18671]|uniref:Putative membrane protein n=1 Tax=Secundilactobacillus oryzae JCM 18671 TaxID=1291743 RepID=A0A081BII6_9LACO|nr:DUF1304 domain-containing protein [Secundilactobacillus oryzae]GAK47854.1 putative membrane protein [Secundilactobacillus oryzae JCM 18671]
MTTLELVLAGIIAVEHLGIMGLEMFGKPEAQAKAFDMDVDFVKLPAARVALGNQGIYNGMLGVSILAALFLFAGATLVTVLSLLMVFVSIVALYGTFTATKKIFVIQFLPAFVTLLLLLFV